MAYVQGKEMSSRLRSWDRSPARVCSTAELYKGDCLKPILGLRYKAPHLQREVLLEYRLAIFFLKVKVGHDSGSADY